jgi:Domain of unknown function (DUF1707)
MSAPGSPPSAPGSPPRHRASYANPGMRVSDAERAEVADRLSKHYGDGRLDQAEFNERLDQAMSAKTQEDLRGLFTDLPDGEAAEDARPRRHGHPERHWRSEGHWHPERYGQLQRHGGPFHRILFLVLVIVITAALGQALVRSYIPWFLIGLLAVLWLRYGPSQHRRP